MPLDGFEGRSESIAVDPKLATKIGAALTSPRSFASPDIAVSCIPVYGVRLTFHRVDNRVDVLICLECGTILTYREGKEVGGAFFEPTPKALIKALKELFPEDPAIQAIEER